jgi:hypothetical protein
MNLKRRALLREVMTTAWGFFRSAAARDEPFDRFSDSLRSAWRFVRSIREFAQQARSVQRVYLSPSLIPSYRPSAVRERREAAFRTAYLTAKLWR